MGAFGDPSFGYGDDVRLQSLLNTLKGQVTPYSRLYHEIDYFTYMIVANQVSGQKFDLHSANT
jgi:hypothetical protein